MRKTRNVTVAVTEKSYCEARVLAARHDVSLSYLVGFILENLPLLSRAITTLRAEDPNFGSEPKRTTYQRREQ